MPMSSVMTANIGTPRTNAANMRWTSAAIHTAPRAPTPGKCPYAPVVSVTACCSKEKASVAVISLLVEEERTLLREVDWHRLAYLAHDVEGDLGLAVTLRVLLDAMGDDGSYERRNAREPRLGVGRPGERPIGTHAVRDRTDVLDHRRGRARLVRAGWIVGEDVTGHRQRAGATTAAEGAILAAAATPAEVGIAQSQEQFGTAPHVRERLTTQVARDFGNIRARRDLAVGRNSAVLRAARAARLVV